MLFLVCLLTAYSVEYSVSQHHPYPQSREKQKKTLLEKRLGGLYKITKIDVIFNFENEKFQFHLFKQIKKTKFD